MITVAIPTHQMERGADFLRQSFNKLREQTFKDFDVVISDNSDNFEIRDVCLNSDLPITYKYNPVKGMAPNTNEAMKMARGELIKVLYLDDFLYYDTALEEINEAFKPEDTWLVTGCVHTYDGYNFTNPHYPYYSNDITSGNNTIGSPSVLTVRNNGALFFDEKLTWLLDCDLYKRYNDRYGLPKILDSLNVAIRLGKHQMTHILSEKIKVDEHDYLATKFK